MRFLISLSLCFHFCSSADSSLKSLRLQRQTVTDPSALQQTTDDLSILARLVNGIFLQEALSYGTVKPDDVIAELLKIEFSDTVRDLIDLKLDASETISILDTLKSDISKLGSNPLSDSKEVSSGIDALNNMKKNVNEFTKGTVQDIGKDFIEEAVKFKTLKFYEPLLDFKKFKEISDFFVFLKNASLGEDARLIATIDDGFRKLKASGALFERTVKDVFDYKHQFENIFKMKNKYNVLEPLFKITEAADAYKNNWNIISTLSTKMSSINTDSIALLPIIKKHGTISSLSDTLKILTGIVNGLLTSKTSSNLLTEGLPNGAKDLVEIKNDLNGPWLKEKIAEGRDMEKLISSMSLTETYSEKLLKLSEDFKEFKSIGNSMNILNEMVTSFHDLGENGKYLTTNNDISTTLTTVINSIENLQQIKGKPPVESFLNYYNYVKKISDDISSFKKAFEKITSDDDGTDDIISKIREFAGQETEKPKLVNEEAIEAVKNIRKINQFDKIVNIVSIVADELEPIISKKFSNYVKQTPDAPVISEVQKCLDGTGLIDALKSFQTQSLDLDSIDKMLKFGIRVRTVKKGDIESSKSLITSIDKMKNEMKETRESIELKTRKRRSEDQIKKLEDAKSVSNDFGKGVNLLRNLVIVQEKRSLFESASEVSDKINEVITSLPELKLIWTDENKKKLKEFPTEIEVLGKYAEENKDQKDLLQIGSILGKASEIEGVPIENKLLNDLVVPTLQNSSDQDVKNAAPTFLELGQLDLDYSKHSASFKASLLTLNSIRTYFDDMFGIDRNPVNQQGSIQQQFVEKEVKNGVSGETLLYSGISAAFVAAIVGGFIYFYCKWKRDRKYYIRLNDPDTWVLLSYTRENEPEKLGSGTCSLAYDYIVRDNLGAFTKCLKNGGYADAKVQSHKQANSLLHEAVLRDKPLFVEALIKAGATRETLNHDKKTPMELAKELKKKRCIKIFKKYEKRRFRVILPEPFPKHDYLIDVDQDISLEEHYHSDFFKKFRQYQAQSDKRPSHFVVKTDKNNILHVKEHHLSMIFHPSMLMGHRWLKACLDNSSKISNNHEYRVTQLMYKKKIYNTVLEIKDFINRQNVPYLFGCGMSYKDHVKYQEWSLYHKLVPQFGIYDGTGEFPYMNYRHGHSYHRDDYARNIFLYRPKEIGEVQNAFKDVWILNPDFAFMSTEDFIHFLLSFKIRSKKIREIEEKNRKNGIFIPGKQYEKKKEETKKKENKNKGDESETSISEQDSGASGSTTTRTPDSRTPESRTPNSRTPDSRTPTSRTPGKKTRH